MSTFNFVSAQFAYNVQTVTSNPLYSDRIADISGDGTGVSYVCGKFNGSMNLGGLVINSFNGAGDSDYFIAKLDAMGTCLWIQRIGNISNQTGIIQIYYYASAVYVCGGFSGTINVGSSSITANGGNDNFIAKFTTAGVFQWVSNTNVLLVSGTTTLNGLAVTSNGIYASYTNGVSNGGVLKVDINNLHAVLWKADFTISANVGATTLYNKPYDIAVDNNGIYVCGAYKAKLIMVGSGIASFKNASGTTVLNFSLPVSNSANAEMDMFLIKYDNNGAFKWGKSYGNSRDNGGCYGWSDEATGVTFNSQQNCIYLTGHFIGATGAPANFGSGFSLVPNGGANTTDVFISKISVSTGTTIWVRQLGGTDCESGGSVTSDNTGNVFLTGRYETKFSIPCYGILSNFYPSGTFIARYNSLGTIQWLTNIEVLDNYNTAVANGGNFNIACDNIGNAYSVLNEFSGNVYPAGSNVLTSSGTDGLISKIKATPSASAGPDVSYCCGSVVIGTSGLLGCTYSWSPTTGLSNASFATPSCTGSGIYTVTCNNGGCITTDNVIVTKGVSCCKIEKADNANSDASSIYYSIYPNPSSTNASFFVESINADEKTETKLSIYSVEGALVMQKVLLAGGKEEINHNLTPGLYIIILQSASDSQTLKLTIAD